MVMVVDRRRAARRGLPSYLPVTSGASDAPDVLDSDDEDWDDEDDGPNWRRRLWVLAAAAIAGGAVFATSRGLGHHQPDGIQVNDLATANAPEVVPAFTAKPVVLPYGNGASSAPPAAATTSAAGTSAPGLPGRFVASLPGGLTTPLPHPFVATVGIGVPTRLTTTLKQIPTRALAAYVNAASTANKQVPGCNLGWTTLAGVGYVASNHGQSSKPPIYGPLLDGKHGVAWPDSDQGKLDGNAQWDRAVGPMMLMPATWVQFGIDGNKDKTKDPQNIDDSALTAADYLCAVSPALDQPANLVQALYSYDHSFSFVRAVLTVAGEYAGVSPVSMGINLVPPDTSTMTISPSPVPKPSVAPPPRKPKPTPARTTPPAPAPTPTSAAPSPFPSPSAPSPTASDSSSPVPTVGD
jgi:hypothetical protein